MCIFMMGSGSQTCMIVRYMGWRKNHLWLRNINKHTVNFNLSMYMLVGGFHIFLVFLGLYSDSSTYCTYNMI